MPQTSITFAADHPVFAGHFPGHPIVPGVLLLDWVQQSVEREAGLTLTGLAATKFLSPALPGETLDLEYEVSESVARFDVRCGARAIATGRFLVGAGAAK